MNLKNQSDPNREGPTFQKIIQLLLLFRPKYSRTLAKINEFTDLDLIKINKLTKRNFKGIIVDTDFTIAPNHQKIYKKNKEHLDKLLSQNFKIVIYSNCSKKERYEDLNKKITVLKDLPPKPDKKGFIKALKTLGLPAKNVVMVGDCYFTDGGSIRIGIEFIKVKPVKEREEKLIMSVKIFFYRIIRGFYNLLSAIYDLFRKKPLTSKQIKNA